MFWDENFWENFLVNYCSSLAATVTLFLLGLGTYEAYRYRKRKKYNKKNN